MKIVSPSDEDPSNAKMENQSAWNVVLQIETDLLTCLWEGRVGNDSVVRELLKKIYAVMDGATELGVLKGLRRSGGIVNVSLLLIPACSPLA